MTIREMTEELEDKTLSKYAVRSKYCGKRVREEEKCTIRTDFARDRDRIIHCKAFRRLKHKTQVFLAPEGDHYRTRLTHTLEVSQIARTIARALRLNEDLTEAVALGHDLGHTPFGHAGERVLRELSPTGFSHMEQSVRVVEKLEKDRKGLNLTPEVIDGILNHAGSSTAKTLEGQIVKYADRIAYINHDIDDAIRGDILKEEDIPYDLRYILGRSHGDRIETMIKAVIAESMDRDSIEMEEPVKKATLSLREFLFENVYKNPVAKGEEGKTMGIIENLYKYFTANPKAMPLEFYESSLDEGIDRAVVDYIAGMTDGYAVKTYQALYIPMSWRG